MDKTTKIKKERKFKQTPNYDVILLIATRSVINSVEMHVSFKRHGDCHFRRTGSQFRPVL
jgi:predicted transcriptional regulator